MDQLLSKDISRIKDKIDTIFCFSVFFRKYKIYSGYGCVKFCDRSSPIPGIKRAGKSSYVCIYIYIHIVNIS